MRISESSTRSVLDHLRGVNPGARSALGGVATPLSSSGPLSQDEAELITALTGGDLRPDGTLDFTTGRTAGRHTGVIPGGMTSLSIASQSGSFTVYGAVDAGEDGTGPGQKGSGLPRGTITGISVDLDPGSSAAARLALLQIGLSYVRDINTGDFSNWPDGAIIPAWPA